MKKNIIILPLNILSIFLSFLSLFHFSSAYATEISPGVLSSAGKTEFASEVNSLLRRSCLKKENTGLYIVSLNRDETLFTLNSDKLFIPASNVKLITSAAALKYFGTDFRFMTTLYTDSAKKGGAINGNMYLKGFGDPFLVSEEIWLMVKDLKNLGIKKITGDLIIDSSYFDKQRTGNGWGEKLGAQAYNAKIEAASLNFNTVTVYVSPAEKIGNLPIVMVDPDTDYIKIDNSAVTVKPGRRNKLIINRVPGEGFDTVTVKGKIASTMKQQKFFLNVSRPTLFTAKVFRKFLEDMGIEVTGKTRQGKVPDSALILVEHQSKPLPLIVRGLNKYSNNFTAEQILKTLGAVAEGPPGTFRKGLNQIRNYLEGIGILKGTYVLEDGSGLSRLNRLSPRQIVTVLKDVYADFKIRPEYLASLSIMGVDGSVKNRLKNEKKLHYKIRVKTGTLNGVNSLSGYASGKNGEVFAFSMLMNFKNGCSSQKARDFQDSLIKAMAAWRR